MKRLLTILFASCIVISVWAQHNSFCIAKDGKTASIVVDNNDWKCFQKQFGIRPKEWTNSQRDSNL